MRWAIALAASAAVLFAAGCAPSAHENALTQEPADCAEFPAALRACAPASCRQPHFFVPNFAIEHRVISRDGDACLYSQSVPGDMMMNCRFSEAGRAEVAADMERMARGEEMSFSFSTADPTPDNAMTRECELRDREGTLIPWGVSDVTPAR